MNRILRFVQRPAGVYHFSVFHQFSGGFGPRYLACAPDGSLFVAHFDPIKGMHGDPVIPVAFSSAGHCFRVLFVCACTFLLSFVPCGWVAVGVFSCVCFLVRDFFCFFFFALWGGGEWRWAHILWCDSPDVWWYVPSLQMPLTGVM